MFFVQLFLLNFQQNKLNMLKYTNIAIIASFFLPVAQLFFPKDIQILIGFFIHFTFGILHGANDLLLIRI
jgi:hypothetical protein